MASEKIFKWSFGTFEEKMVGFLFLVILSVSILIANHFCDLGSISDNLATFLMHNG